MFAHNVSLLLDVIRDVLWLGYVFACSILDFFFSFAASLPLSCLILPLNYLSAHLALCQHPCDAPTRDHPV